MVGSKYYQHREIKELASVDISLTYLKEAYNSA